MTAPPDPHLAEKWFLANGLPAVLRPGALVRRIGPRSAPALAALAAMMVCSAIIVALTGKHTIDINGTPTRTEWFVLGIFVLVLPVAGLVGWAVSRIATVRYRAVAAVIAILVTVVAGFFGGPSPRQFVNMLLETVVVAVILLSTATGLGSVLGWATRMTFAHFATLGALLVRALPVMLLTVLVFFNSLVWTMASTVSRTRLWMALLFLFVIAAAFLVSNTLSRARPIMEPDAKQAADVVRLAGTPFEAMPDRPRRVPLSRPERINVVFVLALSQLAQVLAVAVATGLIFFAFGLILISPELLDDWTHGGSSEGQILGMTFPVPGALIQTTMFLTALTFMYLAARAVSDKEYRAEFLDPVLDDLRLTLTARDRYRTATATSPGNCGDRPPG